MDDNGVNGNISSPGEAIADIYAILRLNNSCVGRGFFKNQVCGGYGDACDRHAGDGLHGRPRRRLREPPSATAAHGITWIQRLHLGQCGGTGPAPARRAAAPCGRETHCEGQIVGRGGLGPAAPRPAGGALQLRREHGARAGHAPVLPGRADRHELVHVRCGCETPDAAAAPPAATC